LRVGFLCADFLDACKKIKDAGFIPLTTDDAYTPQAFGTHLARLMGSKNVADVVLNNGWDKPEVLAAAQAFEQLAAKGYFSKLVGSNVWPTGQNTEFATGKVAMYCVGTYLVNEVKNITGSDFEWGFFIRFEHGHFGMFYNLFNSLCIFAFERSRPACYAEYGFFKCVLYADLGLFERAVYRIAHGRRCPYGRRYGRLCQFCFSAAGNIFSHVFYCVRAGRSVRNYKTYRLCQNDNSRFMAQAGIVGKESCGSK